MFGQSKNKLKISDAVIALVERAAEISGASSIDEFADNVLEREAQRIINEAGKGDISQAAIDDIANKLKGLGYLE